MTNQGTLAILLQQLATMTNKAISKQDAISKGLTEYLYLDNYPMYGGYNLVEVNITSGAHYNSFNSFDSCGNRVTAKVMIEKIRSFMSGLNYNNKN